MTDPLLIPEEHNTSKSIRQILRTKRKALTTAFQQTAAEALLLRLKNDIVIKEAKYIALYLANNGELDLQPFIRWCWQQNKHIYLPIVHPFAKGHLLFLRYEHNSTMVINRYNIEEPKLDVRGIKPIQQLDIMLTPLVAFDSTGARIGMGGGYYDRTLAKWYEHYRLNKESAQDKHYSLSIIGVAHDCQQITKVPHETWDIPLPKIMTPTRTLYCKPSLHQ
ncbi:MAG: 5-formyltetrahydrofolate cyclo-ligase [Gammaproteobacteria bacterium]|nr:MAG: 5-formyltetrahydrofolate cyclo-ligase [Gammaproteobacteria bacterium]PHR84340.1 MAG: 5-formyltetrahydrofolate cyclo-ligase [Colwellia sp.]